VDEKGKLIPGLGMLPGYKQERSSSQLSRSQPLNTELDFKKQWLKHFLTPKHFTFKTFLILKEVFILRFLHVYVKETSLLAKNLYTPFHLGSNYSLCNLKLLGSMHFNLLILLEHSFWEIKFQAGP